MVLQVSTTRQDPEPAAQKRRKVYLHSEDEDSFVALKNSPFSFLPDEIVEAVFYWLDDSSLATCKLICHRWFAISTFPFRYLREVLTVNCWFASEYQRLLSGTFPSSLSGCDVTTCDV